MPCLVMLALTSADGAITQVARFTGAAVSSDCIKAECVLIAAVQSTYTLIMLWKYTQAPQNNEYLSASYTHLHQLTETWMKPYSWSAKKNNNNRSLLSSLIFLLGQNSLKAAHGWRVTWRKALGLKKGKTDQSFLKCEDRLRARLQGTDSH